MANGNGTVWHTDVPVWAKTLVFLVGALAESGYPVVRTDRAVCSVLAGAGGHHLGVRGDPHGLPGPYRKNVTG